MNIYQKFVKRAIDVIAALIGILILALPSVIVAILIIRDTKGPVIFTQERTGKNKKVFEIYKFRTMHTGTPSMSGLELDENGSYITRVGRILRKYSIDEIPQLLNILKGDMSIVGPRPDRANPSVPYSEIHLSRFKMKPGLTGLAQTNGRNELGFEERRNYDVEYVRTYSLLLDFKIMIKTFKVLLFKEGIYNSNKSQ